MEFVRTQAPLPKTVRKVNPSTAARKSKYDFAGMQVGDSDLSINFGDEKKAIARLNSAIAIYRKKTKDARRFVVRVYDDAEAQCRVLGVWCLAPATKAEADAQPAEAAVEVAEAEQAAPEAVEQPQE